VNNKLEMFWKMAFFEASLEVLPGSCSRLSKRIDETFIRTERLPGREEYKTEALPAELTCSVNPV
jgi:hypothetical protein